MRLPPHVHAVRARGKDYYYFQRFRGTAREVERVKLPGTPFDGDGMPNAEWWEAYRLQAGERLPGVRAGSDVAPVVRTDFPLR